MNLGCLTVQGVEAAKRQQNLRFSGFSGLGDVSAGSQAALRGSTVDVVLNIGAANRVFFYDARLAQSLKDRLNNSGFRVINLDASNLGSLGGGGTIRARVQILTDGFASANDAASVVGGAAAALGYNMTGSSGILVSSGQQTGGQQTGSNGSGQQYDQPINTGDSNPVETLWSNLTQSPISMAVVVGGAAILLLVALKK